jgi:hypothetical protein
MKIFLIIFFTILLKCNFLFANEFNWEKVATSKDGTNDYFLDSKSNRIIGNYTYLWILTNKIKDFDEVKSYVDYVTIDCKRNKMQRILESGYSEYSGKGKITNHRLISEDELEWLIAKPKTIRSTIIEISCNDMISSISSNKDNSGQNESKNKNKKKKKKKFKEF